MSHSADTKRTVRSLRELSQGLAPARDLWPGIAAQLPRRRSWAVPAGLAAGIVFLSMAVAIGMQLRHRAPSGTDASQGGMIRAALMTDPDYQRRRDDLLEGLPAKLDALPAESRQRVADSLQAIQAAMRDIETELGRESGNAVLQQLLISTSQEEMRVLIAISAADGLLQEI